MIGKGLYETSFIKGEHEEFPHYQKINSNGDGIKFFQEIFLRAKPPTFSSNYLLLQNAGKTSVRYIYRFPQTHSCILELRCATTRIKTNANHLTGGLCESHVKRSRDSEARGRAEHLEKAFPFQERINKRLLTQSNILCFSTRRFLAHVHSYS